MNDPMSRKLFQNRDAREKLRGMGGIMASSPELAQTVAKFADGTLVEGPNPAANRRRQGYLIFLQQMGLPDTPQSQEMYSRMMEQQALAQLSATPRLAGAGVDMSPAPIIPGQDAPQNALGRLRPTQFVGTGADLPPTQIDLTTPAPPRAPAPPPSGARGPESYFETLRRITGEAADVAGGMGVPIPNAPDLSFFQLPVSNIDADVGEFGGLPPEMTQPGGTVEPSEDISLGRVAGDLGFGPALAPVRERREEAEQREAAAAATERAILPQMEREMRDRAAQEERAVAAELAAESDVQRRAAEELAQDTDEGDGAGAGTFDFDTTYAQMLERVGRVMGEGAKKDDREKAMANLAMIGLAIAAGQSPDALTNIAQGALSGMQAIRAQEAREEDLARESRLTALEMAESAADRASRERVAMMRASGDPRVSTYQDPFRDYAVVRDEALRAAMAGNAPDILEGETPIEYADRVGRAAVAAAQGPFTADTGVTVPSTAAPTITTQAEYDALPPGAEFIQNGQRRRKPE